MNKNNVPMMTLISAGKSTRWRNVVDTRVGGCSLGEQGGDI